MPSVRRSLLCLAQKGRIGDALQFKGPTHGQASGQPPLASLAICSHGKFKIHKACDIPAGFRQTFNNASRDRINHLSKHDRNCASGSMKSGRSRRAVDENDFRRGRHEFGNVSLQPVGKTRNEPIIGFECCVPRSIPVPAAPAEMI